MLRSTLSLLRYSNITHNISKTSVCYCSTQAESSPPQLLPSIEFMRNASKRGLTERLSRIIAEIEVMKEFTHELPNTLNNSQWDYLLHIRDFGEREEYLRCIYFSEISHQRTVQKNEEETHFRSKTLAEKQRRYDAGEMVYGRGFYDFLDLRGSDFRRQIDIMHGSRLLAQERVNEKMPQLIIDCQYLHKNSEKNIAKFVGQVKPLYDHNWFNPHPFRLSICNLLMDDFVARLVRSKWAFALGISPKTSATMDENFPKFDLTEYEDLEEIFPVKNTDNVVKHEFTPKITSRGIKTVLDSDITPNEIAVISKTATRYLDDDISKFKAFVLHTTTDHYDSWQTVATAAAHDGLIAYRIPFDKHVKWVRGTKDMTLSRVAETLKAVYTGQDDWHGALTKNVSSYNIDETHGPNKEELTIQEARQERIKAMKDAIRQLHYRTMNPSSGANSVPVEKRPRVHRYSREERNRRRAAAAIGNSDTIS